MKISYNDYQLITRETSGCDDIRVLALGLIGETSELIESFENLSAPSKKLPLVVLTKCVSKEIGDILWYAARLYDVLDENFEDWQNFGNVCNFKTNVIDKNFVMRILKHAAAVSEHVKKVTGHGHELDHKKMMDSLSNVVRDCKQVAHALYGKNGLEIIMKENVEKLSARYPDGFTTERSKNRNLDDVGIETFILQKREK